MDYFVIGDDKSWEEAYTKADVDSQISGIRSEVTDANTAIANLQNSIGGINNYKITSGTSAPSGGSNGDIYIQY